jgi:HK97 family phage portal protein
MFERLKRLFAKAVTRMQLVPTWKIGRPVYNKTNFPNMVVHGWRKNELIFACIDKTAKTSSQIKPVVWLNDKAQPDHKLAKLLAKPNLIMDFFDFMYHTITVLKLAARAPYEIEKNNRGEPIALWPLRPDWLLPVPGGEVETKEGVKEFIAYYEYTVPGREPKRVEIEDILEFRLLDPLDLYSGYPPVAVAARVGDVDNKTTDMIKQYYDEGGIPPGLLKSKIKLTKEDAKALRERWAETYGGSENWASGVVVLDQDADYQKTGSNLQEMGLEFVDQRNEARICMVLQVPPILISASIGLDRATYANYKEARQAWWEDTVQPEYVNLLSALNAQLANQFGQPGLEVRLDYSKVPALQEDLNKTYERADTGVSGGWLTVNQALKMVGQEDGGNSGEVYLRSPLTVEVPKGSAQRSARADNRLFVAKLLMSEGMPLEEAVRVVLSTKVADPPDLADRENSEQELSNDAAKFFKGEFARITQRLAEEHPEVINA